MADAMTYCVHCQRRGVVIARDQDGCLVRCQSCQRAWSYRSSRLSDEILLANYAARASAAPWANGADAGGRPGGSTQPDAA
jgi:hypothetical protein